MKPSVGFLFGWYSFETGNFVKLDVKSFDSGVQFSNKCWHSYKSVHF